MTKPSSYGKATAKPSWIFWAIHIFLFSFFSTFCCKKRGLFFSNRELPLDADGFQVMKFSKESQTMRHIRPHTVSAETVLQWTHPVAFEIFHLSFHMCQILLSCKGNYTLQQHSGASVFFNTALIDVTASYQLISGLIQ